MACSPWSGRKDAADGFAGRLETEGAAPATRDERSRTAIKQVVITDRDAARAKDGTDLVPRAIVNTRGAAQTRSEDVAQREVGGLELWPIVPRKRERAARRPFT